MSRHYLIVGAGSAGSVVTRRLLDAGHQVTLLEAGKADANPAIHDMSRMGELWHSEDDWSYYTVPQSQAANRALHWPRGKVQGGSHSLNAAIWVRGAHGDYDRWEREGATGWAWKDVLPYFKKIENTTIGDDTLRGRDGLLDVGVDSYERNPIFAALHEAALQAGVPANSDYNGAEIEGIGFEQLNIRDGKRLSTFRAYTYPVLNHPNLEAHVEVWVNRLIIEDGKAVGVEATVGDELKTFTADEVILSAGALDTPRILMLSGIGPREHLEEVGIEVILDAPGVGDNLHDHLLAPVIVHTDKKAFPAPQSGEPISQLHHFTTFRTGSDVPDTQPIYFSVPMLSDGMQAPPSTFTIHAGLVRPTSRGTVRLASSSPTDPVLFDPQLLSTPEDMASLVASVKQCREIATQPAIRDEWGSRELYPGPEVQTDEEIENYIRNNCVTYHHQVGTCRMGTDEHAVVDPATLQLRGIEGVRVIDASVMPSVPSGNTNAPSVMIGERGADFIIREEL